VALTLGSRFAVESTTTLTTKHAKSWLIGSKLGTLGTAGDTRMAQIATVIISASQMLARLIIFESLDTSRCTWLCRGLSTFALTSKRRLPHACTLCKFPRNHHASLTLA